MTWQEITTGALVLVAVGYLYRRFRGKPSAPTRSGRPDVPVSRLKKKR
ncbi:MAG: hypothetical protein WBG86_11815 [Polyangiales bacterium]